MDEQKPDEELQEEIEEIESAETPAEEQPVEEVPAEIVAPVEEAPAEETAQPELPQKLVEQPKHIGAPVPGKMERLKTFIMECKRVLRVTKKPDKQEFYTIVKISAVGIAIIGFIGFLVHFAKELLIK
ncbi:Protein translocase subunit SecE [uncultured archaeon]|nr:Protein translocase subunit SecE [uncultured archaeon]